ncbi:MAG: hypothetical protein C4527_07610 [Candidatus Omnitrophota bacterium]|jgi:hypothetical protein|nr:MAG: hypothetical protein C4527_07610 [Candidatus Omnitrophota bacterium]
MHIHFVKMDIDQTTGDVMMATENERNQDPLKQWAAAWRRASAVLEKERIASMRRDDYDSQLVLLDDAIDWSIKHSPLLQTSGLIEQQAIFQRIREQK